MKRRKTSKTIYSGITFRYKNHYLDRRSPDKIPQRIRDTIFSGSEIYFSAVSVWEMAIRLKTGKLKLQQLLPDLIDNFKEGYSFQFLPIAFLIFTKPLNFLYHRDLFDRLLVAQSLVENLPVISLDDVFDSYIANRIW